MKHIFYVNKYHSVNPNIDKSITSLTQYHKWDGTVNTESIFQELKQVFGEKDFIVKFDDETVERANTYIGQKDGVSFLADTTGYAYYSAVPFGCFIEPFNALDHFCITKAR